MSGSRPQNDAKTNVTVETPPSSYTSLSDFLKKPAASATNDIQDDAELSDEDDDAFLELKVVGLNPEDFKQVNNIVNDKTSTPKKLQKAEEKKPAKEPTTPRFVEAKKSRIEQVKRFHHFAPPLDEDCDAAVRMVREPLPDLPKSQALVKR